MAKQFKLRRGTTAQHSAFIGASGEVTVDTTKSTLVVHDATTPGGIPLAREDLSNIRTAILEAVYPIGSIYTNAVNSNNPSTVLGFGTWVAFGAGRVLVGQDSSDTLMDVLEETGGSKDAIIVAHTHNGTTASSGAHTHGFSNFLAPDNTGGSKLAFTNGDNSGSSTAVTDISGAHTHTFTTDSAGSSGTNANLQPYVVVKMWKRTA